MPPEPKGENAPPTVTVVIPTRNEEGTIAELIQKARLHAEEIVVVDAHSSDRTREIAGSLSARVEIDDGRGKGEAIRRGIAAARGEIVVCMDADGSHDPADIPALIAPIVANDADLVVGCRIKGGSDELHGTMGQTLRFTGSVIITLIINYRWNVGLTDVENGFRAVRRDAALSLNLRENDFTIEQAMVMKALKRGLRVKNVPSHEYARRYGHSNIRLWRIWPSFLWSVFKHLF